MNIIDALLLLAVIVFTVIVVVFFVVGKRIHKDVEKALDEATTAEQEIIRKQLVKAMFPPRFNR